MCKIFDWVFDSVSVEQAPQNHFEDPNQFNQDEDVANNTIFDFVGNQRLAHVHPAIPVEPPRAALGIIADEINYDREERLRHMSNLWRRIQDCFVSFILKKA